MRLRARRTFDLLLFVADVLAAHAHAACVAHPDPQQVRPRDHGLSQQHRDQHVHYRPGTARDKGGGIGER
jgi:hypothetical protein